MRCEIAGCLASIRYPSAMVVISDHLAYDVCACYRWSVSGASDSCTGTLIRTCLPAEQHPVGYGALETSDPELTATPIQTFGYYSVFTNKHVR